MSVDQAVWALVGLLTVTLLGNFWYLGSKIDSINSRIDSLGERLDGRIDGLAERLDGRMDALSTQLQTHIERHVS